MQHNDGDGKYPNIKSSIHQKETQFSRSAVEQLLWVQVEKCFHSRIQRVLEKLD